MFLYLNFISKLVRYIKTNLYSSAIAQLSRRLLHTAAPLLILSLQVPSDCRLVFHISYTHFWITCYKPIFFFFSVVFLPQGNLCWLQASVDILIEDQQGKNSFAFPNLSHHQKLFLFALKGASVSSTYSLCSPYKIGCLLCNLPIKVFCFPNFSTWFALTQ